MDNNDSVFPSETPLVNESTEQIEPLEAQTQAEAPKKRRSRSDKKKNEAPKRHLKQVHDSLASIRKPSLKRLGRRAGIRRFTTGFYERIRIELDNQLRGIMKKCYLYTESRNRKTVNAACVARVFRESGKPIYVAFDS